MPRRELIALTPGDAWRRDASMTVPGSRAARCRGSTAARAPRGRGGCSAGAAPWRRWWRFPAPLRSPAATAGAPPARCARVGAEHAGHVGPDLDPRAPQQGAEVGGRGIRAAAPENRRAAVGGAGDEALGDRSSRRRPRRSAARRPASPTVIAGHRQPARPVALVGQRLRVQPVARIQPAHVQALAAQVGHAQRGRQQLALRQHLGLPGQVAAGAARVRRASARSSARRSPSTAGVQPKLGGERRGGAAPGPRPPRPRRRRRRRGRRTIACSSLVTPDTADTTTSTARRSSLGTPFHQLPDGVPALASGHAGAAELEDDPVRCVGTVGRCGGLMVWFRRVRRERGVFQCKRGRAAAR